MKKLLLLCLTFMLGFTANARPVKPGQWTTATLKDGSTVSVELMGDEHLRYYRAADGSTYRLDAETKLFEPIGPAEMKSMRKNSAARKDVASQRQQQTRRRLARMRKEEGVNPFIGEKRGLVILVEYQDVKFQNGHDLALFNDILNKENYTDNGFHGSARDYFREQSGGKFTLDFDVVGPCTLQNNRKYYSANSDENAVEMIVEACEWAHEQGVDFSKYDWDGDGYVDEVFVVYAGPGYSSQNPNAVYPYMYYLSEEGYPDITYDGVKLDTYACSCEMYSDTRLSGIGSFLPTTGVMITHIDYDSDVWDYMVENESNGYYYTYTDDKGWHWATNDHQRIQLVHCDNSTSLYDAAGYNNPVLYPSVANKSLSKTSKPASTLYNANADGTKFLHVAVNNITLDPKSLTASMDFVPDGYTEPTDPTDPTTPIEGEQVFYESFDKCAGVGGNDNSWSVPETYPAAVTDNDGWTAGSGSYLRAADKCLWLEGAKRKGGSVTSPEFTVDGTVTLQFKAGALTAGGNSLTLTAEGGTLGETSFAMENGKWTTYTVTLTANGAVKLTFQNDKGSFLLDEVRVVKPESTGINGINGNGKKAVAGFYTVGGVRLSAPQKGVNIVRLSDGSTRKVIF